MSDLIDIGLVAVLVYAVIVAVRGARAHLALAGIGILACVYLLARQLGLELTAWIFQAFFAVFLIVLVVIFQEELRQAFERIAAWGLRSARRRQATADPSAVLVRAVDGLASVRRGALIVIPGRDPIERIVEGGVSLEGRLSEPLLLSLFDPNSPGHDGAVVLDGDRVRLFAAHLPLSLDRAQLGMRGTRHAAALGLAERADTLCVIVSEESGRVSVAKEGRLTELCQPTELAAWIREHLQEEAGPEPGLSGRFRALRESWREATIAIGIAVVLWGLVIPGSKESAMAVQIPVRVKNLPVGYTLEKMEPERVDVTVSGLRRDLFFLDSKSLEVTVDAFLVKLGRRTFEVSPESVRHPASLTISSVDPKKIVLSVKEDSSGRQEASVGAVVEEKAQ